MPISDVLWLVFTAVVGAGLLVLAICFVEDDTDVLRGKGNYARALGVWSVSIMVGAALPWVLPTPSFLATGCFIAIHISLVGVAFQSQLVRALVWVFVEWGLAGLSYLLLGTLWYTYFV